MTPRLCLVWLLAAVVMVLSWLVATPSAITIDATDVAVNLTYDAPGRYGTYTSDTFERGPPRWGYTDNTYHAADGLSYGASAPLEAAKNAGSSTYTATYSSAHAARPTATTHEPVQVISGCVSALQQAQAAANTGMAGVRATGRTGEELAGIIKNTDHIPSASGSAAYRIPDELNSSVLGEVKNVSHLSYTRQLRDFTSYAQSNGLTFNLYVRGSTNFSTPLQNMIDSGVITRVPNLGP